LFPTAQTVSLYDTSAHQWENYQLNQFVAHEIVVGIGKRFFSYPLKPRKQ